MGFLKKNMENLGWEVSDANSIIQKCFYFIQVNTGFRLFSDPYKSQPQSSEPWLNILRTPIGILLFALEERSRRQPQPPFEIQHI